MSEFGNNIVYLRKKHGLSQAALSSRLGISRSALSMYELGNREPPFDLLKSFADVFGVDYNYLLGGFDSFTFDEVQMIKRFRLADEDDKIIVNAALRKYGIDND